MVHSTVLTSIIFLNIAQVVCGERGRLPKRLPPKQCWRTVASKISLACLQSWMKNYTFQAVLSELLPLTETLHPK